MTDCTLDQYYGITDGELGQILQAEARKMFGSDSLENDSEDAGNHSCLTSQQRIKKTEVIFSYWESIKTFIYLPFQIFQKYFQT